MNVLKAIALPVLSLTLLVVPAAAQDTPSKPATQPHPAIGSWYGRAVQLCGEPLSACPKASLTMTPTISADGAFVGNDTFAIAGAPFGPHTTAHGVWTAVSPTKITADYVFLNVAIPDTSIPCTGAARFRWQAEAVDANTMVGYVNFFPQPGAPNVWEQLGKDDFPTVPLEIQNAVKPPEKFYTDPKECNFNPACPLIFKFKILRVVAP